MGRVGRINGYLWRLRWVFYSVSAAVFVALVYWLRQFDTSADPLFFSYLEVIGTLLSFTFAANALVRFRGTHDRIALILAFGFILSGLIELAATFGLTNVLAGGPEIQLRVPITWMVSRTLLGVVLLAALIVEKRLPNSREPSREIAAALLIVGAVGYLTSAVYLGAPGEPLIRPAALLSRPWDLVPASIFFVAAIFYQRRLRGTASAFDRALCWTAWLNVASLVAASQSERLLDPPFTLAQLLRVTSYAVVLGGALVDNARLFEQVRRLSISYPLTGLGNYRRLLDALNIEVERSRRSSRPFSILLLDLDGLKQINDRYGHLVGSRALCRLGNVLRIHCRAMDTAARYGGDEFALILPEAGGGAAGAVAKRICERLASDGEAPPLSVSVGAAVFPEDGETIEKLLASADRALYRMKGRRTGTVSLARIAACL